MSASSRSQIKKSSSSGVPAKTSSCRGSKTSTSSAGAPCPCPKTPKKYELPALSTTYVPKVTESELEKLKKRHIRRNAPPGEDLKCIKTILKNIKDQNITVQEFISLIAPSTGDQGEVLRQVMNEDLANFRKLARKVYDTITQDNSDVLLNQQMQLCEYYKEKKKLLNNKLMNMIEELFSLAPNFDFDLYARDKEQYLHQILPIPEPLTVEPEELEMLKRQAAYHRLQWLRSEGERLNEENNSLKKRLTQMKRLHMEEQKRILEIEKMAEAKKDALEEEEAEKQDILETLNKSLEKTIIAHEKSMRLAKDASVLDPSTGAIKKTKSKTKMKRTKKPRWNEEAASEIEGRKLEEAKVMEKRKIARERDPFHFSPIKTPPPRQSQSRERSPFHYSPPRSPVVPPGATSSPARPGSPRNPPPPVQEPYRRAQAPRDTWGGFY